MSGWLRHCSESNTDQKLIMMKDFLQNTQCRTTSINKFIVVLLDDFDALELVKVLCISYNNN